MEAFLVELGGLFTAGWWQQNWAPLLNIIMIDVVLAGDNAIIVGLAASRVAPENRAKVIFWGIAGAVILRILFAGITNQLLQIVGLTLAGGLLLLFVCWKMYRQISEGAHDPDEVVSAASADAAGKQPVSFPQAVLQVVIADVTMSLDNVLAVAGAAGKSTACPRDRVGHRHRVDGRRIALHRKNAGALSMDHMDRASDNPLCRARHDL